MHFQGLQGDSRPLLHLQDHRWPGRRGVMRSKSRLYSAVRVGVALELNEVVIWREAEEMEMEMATWLNHDGGEMKGKMESSRKVRKKLDPLK